MILCLALSLASLSQAVPKNASYLAQRFVTVSPDVQLEVLDWGGSGRDLVLLAGGGNTAHVYASLAPNLAKQFHVFGITRRGAGQSSTPSSGYTARQFGDDVVAVLDTLHLTNPVLIGHSIAGEEMSSVSKHHPGRVSDLIYMDAGGPFALYNPEHGDIDLDRVELQQDLSKLGEDQYGDALITKRLLTRLVIGVTCKTCVMRSKARLHLHRLRLTCPTSPHFKSTSLWRKKYPSMPAATAEAVELKIMTPLEKQPADLSQSVPTYAQGFSSITLEVDLHELIARGFLLDA